MTLRVSALACLSLTASSRQPTLAAAAAGVGLFLYMWSLRSQEPSSDSGSFRWAGIALILILVVRFTGTVNQFSEWEEMARPLWIGLLIAAGALALVWGHKRIPRRLSIAAALLAVVFITGVMTVGEWRSELGVDVYWMHREAGEALFDGQNPYTDAVRVWNGSPYAPEGSIVEGYPYPPVVLGTYAVTANDLDPRLVSSLCWFAVLAWMAWHAKGSGRRADVAYSMFLLLAGAAVWPVVWYAAWTEPLSIGLILLTAIWWRSRPVWSAITLGLAIASKQYFIFLAPLLLLHKDESKKMRLMVSLGVATATLLMGLIPDTSAFVSATILNLSDLGFRPDTQSLSGLLAANDIEFYLSSLAWIALGLLLAVFASVRSHGVSDFVGRGGLIMGLAFFFGLAFSNYWFLVMALIAVASIMSAEEESERRARAVAWDSTVPISPVANT